MTPETVLMVGKQALEATAMLAGPPLLVSLAVGLVVAMFQAATQINEMTLTFIPKLIAIGLVIMMAGPWLLEVATGFTTRLYMSIPELIG